MKVTMDLELLIRDFCAAAGVPAVLRDPSGFIHHCPEDGFLPTPAEELLEWSSHCAVNPFLTTSPDFMRFGCVRSEEDGTTIVIGPALEFACTRHQGQRILERMRLPLTRLDELLRQLRRWPPCTAGRLREIVRFLDRLLNGEKLADEDMLTDGARQVMGQRNRHHDEKADGELDGSKQNTLREEKIQHVPYPTTSTVISRVPDEPAFVGALDSDVETQILSCIEHGRTKELAQVLNDLDSSGERMPHLAEDALRAFRNTYIMAVGLASRTAIRGGLGYAAAIAVSDTYLELSETLNSYPAIVLTLKRMFLDFTGRTARARMPQTDSALVLRISREVRNCLSEHVTAEVIAKKIGMSRAHLNRVFHKETGQTITDHIRALKIDEAKRLLGTTDLPLVRISEQLGFSSQHYFQTVFKLVAGVTPAGYRNGLGRRESP